MAELPHYKSRVPDGFLAPRGNILLNTDVPHPYSGNFPAGYNPSDGDDQTLDPVGGVVGPIVDATTGTASVAPAAGKWTPLGSIAPADLAAANAGATPNPNSLWTVGQFIILGDGSEAYCSAPDTWLAGKAPA